MVRSTLAATLVPSHHEWPGLVSKTLTEKITVRRPDWYFDKETDLPDELELELTPPPMMAHKGVEELQLELDKAIEKRIDEKKLQMSRTGEEFAGREKVLEAKPSMKAISPEPIGGRIPKVAIADKEKRIAWFKEQQAWQREYRRTWTAWREGKDAKFPVGTWHVHVHLGAKRAVASRK